LWTLDSPFLYDLELVLMNKDGNVTDRIKSYFGMRKISLGKDAQGITRLMLNSEFIFQLGPLDQGWWPDGLYTAPIDEALRYDIEVTKQVGFNMVRKHVKIEPDRWYYWCDKMGLLVWQDMPSGDQYIGGDDPDIERSPESARQFETELKAMIDGLYNHPSIIIWVPYNEGWGQWDTPRITNLIKSWDPTRLVNSASGWTDRGVGDVYDIHSYPGPAMPEPEVKRAIVLGEFGGLGLPIEGHTWQDKDNWGYRSFQSTQDLIQAYTNLMIKLNPMIERGLSAAIYTQTTDVEVEVNGLMTYDRAIIKMKPEEIIKINQGFLPPIILADSEIFLESLQVKLISRKPGEIYYALDGSEPNRNSKRYEIPIILDNTVTVKARTYFSAGCKSAVNEHTYKKVSLRKPEKTDRLKPGIRYRYYENDGELWQQLPDFLNLKPRSEGITEEVNLSKAKRGENFGLIFLGYFNAPVDGIYTFFITSDDGSKLYIGPKEIVPNDFLHGMEERKGQIALKAGYHQMTVTFFQGRGGKGLKLFYQAPDNGPKKLLTNLLFYQDLEK